MKSWRGAVDGSWTFQDQDEKGTGSYGRGLQFFESFITGLTMVYGSEAERGKQVSDIARLSGFFFQ